MRSRWLRWMIWITLGCFAIPTLLLVVAFIRNPQTAALFVTMLVYPLFGNTSPPSMFAADIAGMWFKWDEAGRKITTHLQEQFPAGTSEAALKSALAKQGFKPLPPPPANCVPAGQQVPVGKVQTRCPTGDPGPTLVYQWGGFGCTSTVSVRWESDSRQNITQVNGGYYGACL